METLDTTVITGRFPQSLVEKFGFLHLHVDGGSQGEAVEKLAREGGKFQRILASRAGPQRLYEPVYARHNPKAPDGHESYGFFSTFPIALGVHSRRMSEEILRTIGSVIATTVDKVRGMPDLVVELERTVAFFAPGLQATIEDFELNPIIALSEPGGPPQRPIEIHHSINIERRSGDPAPFSLEELGGILTLRGVEWGGLFLFEKAGGEWAYRTNAFAQVDHRFAEAAEQHFIVGQVLREECAKRELRYRASTMVEEVISLWSTPPSVI